MRHEVISGLQYAHAYLNDAEQAEYVTIVDEQPWLDDLKRRVQHYGYRYDYKRRKVDDSMYLGPLPDWAALLAERLNHDGYAPQVPDQLIVNEYEPGQGIASHIDCIPCFGDTILALTLGSSCIMQFQHRVSKIKVPVFLEQGSLVVMQGESRYDWKHGIPARKSDVYAGRKIPRRRRLSLTFRTVLKEI